MGNVTSWSWSWSKWLWGSAKSYRILMLGLDNAGKTTILYTLSLKLANSEMKVTTIPTIGFNVETVDISDNIKLTVWDVGGQEKLRSLWRHYYDNTDGVIFVVDSADSDRFHIVRDELMFLNDQKAMQDVPFLILCNKQDLPGAKRTTEIAVELEIVEMMKLNPAEQLLPNFKNKKRRREYFLQGVVGTTLEAHDLQWLVQQVE